MGSIYRPTYKDRDGNKRKSAIWWVKFYVKGKAIRESTERTDYDEAKSVLKEREGDGARGLVAPQTRRATFGDLAEDMLNDYRMNGYSSLADVKARFDLHILPAFGNRKASSIDTASIRQFIADRQEAEAANGEIIQELNHIKRAFNLGLQSGRIRAVPHIPMPKAASPRQGFFERDQLEAVIRHLPDYLQGPARFSYLTGWRKNEILGLEWHQVDFESGRVRLEPGTTKNDDGRVFPFTAELRAVLEAQRARADALKQRGIICPWVFPSRRNARIVDYKRAWRTACLKAGAPGRIFHDFRRTAVRNLERAGVPRSVAMRLTGHKTESVYRRYDIVSEGDLDIAAAKLEEFTGKDTGKVGRKTVRRETLHAVK